MATSRPLKNFTNLSRLSLACPIRTQSPVNPLNSPRVPRIPTNPLAVPFRLSSTASSASQSSNTSPTPPNSSVDPTEVAHFNALASSWWDPHGPSRLLHLMNPLRHTFINRCLSSQPISPSGRLPQLRYLDIGCGGGIFAESAGRLPTTRSVTAIDPSTEILAVARAHAKRDPLLMNPERLTYLNKSVEQLPLPKMESEQFDIVSLFEVLEHVTHPASFLTSIMPHVKPGGWLVLSTIARTWTSWAVTKVMAEDVMGIVPKGTHDWAKYINDGELREWFGRQEGWDSMKTMGVIYVLGLGWKEVPGGGGWGNYFFAVRRER